MIEQFAKRNQLLGYRVDQYNLAYYGKLIESFGELTTWPKDLRTRLASEVDFSSIEPVKELKSGTGDTIKVLFRRKSDGKAFESVLMRYKDGRNSVCVSCMVGCPVGCVFCATGKMGFGANLSSQQIVDQVLHFGRELKAVNQEVTNVVFMGMGEPLLNLDAVMETYRILTDKTKFGLGKRRVTVSTSGYVPQIKELVDRGFKGKLAVSLHAPSQELRANLMRIAKVYPLDKLMTVLDRYVERTKRRVSYEYVLIEEVNDDLEHAGKLVNLLKKRLAHVNLIPYNPIPGQKFRRSSLERVRAFARILEVGGVAHTIRITMGDDIKAACGQLVLLKGNSTHQVC